MCLNQDPVLARMNVAYWQLTAKLAIKNAQDSDEATELQEQYDRDFGG